MKFRMKRVTILAGAALALSTFAAPAAHAEELTCTGPLGAVTVDNLRVPSGRTCTLTGTTVQGTITIEGDAVLRAYGVAVVGNVQGEGAKNVQVLDGSSVGGSVQIVQGSAARVANSAVNGDVLFDDNRATVRALRNDIGGNLQAFRNTGGVVVRTNVIDGNLQCTENVPAPTGGGNLVQGSKENQCAHL